jgi:hypothetical protein
MIADAEGALRKMEAAQVAAGDRTKRQAQRQLEALQKQHQAQLTKAQKELRRLTPLKDLKDWYIGEIASKEWVTERMVAMGYPPALIEAHFAKWDQGKGQKGPEVLDGAAASLPPTVTPPAPHLTTIQGPATAQIAGTTPTIPPPEGT